MEEGAVADVSVALANWNGIRYIERCLSALYAQKKPPAEVVVVDNGSTDGSREWIAQHCPQVTLLLNEANEGFAAGYNRAIAACSHAWILVLNTDVFLEEDFIEEALPVLMADPTVGAVTGKVYQQATHEWLNSGFFLRPQMRTHHSPQLDAVEDVFGCSGALILFRRAALDDMAVDGQVFDECYFSYGEDVDLAWRAQLLGWKARYVPSARALHVGSGSSNEQMRFVDKPIFLQRHILKNRYLTLAKNTSWVEAIPLVCYWLISEPLVWLVLFLRSPRSGFQLLPAVLDALRWMPRALRWRKAIQVRRIPGAVQRLRFFKWI
jgi:GT2 family glycosyltransferase